jgi:hypothetical protein
MVSAALHWLAGWRGYIVLIALVLAGAAAAQSGAGHKILLDTGLAEAPASFTSLSFRDPNQLPLQLPYTRVSIGISFDIANSGRLAHTYQWRLLLVRGRKTSQLETGAALVQGSTSVSLHRVARIDCARGKVGLEVQLQEPTESIQAWLTCSSRRAPAR